MSAAILTLPWPPLFTSLGPPLPALPSLGLPLHAPCSRTERSLRPQTTPDDSRRFPLAGAKPSQRSGCVCATSSWLGTSTATGASLGMSSRRRCESSGSVPPRCALPLSPLAFSSPPPPHPPSASPLLTVPWRLPSSPSQAAIDGLFVSFDEDCSGYVDFHELEVRF